MQQDSSSSSSEKPAQITAAAHNNTSADNNSYSHTTPASDQIRAVVRTQWADDDFLPPSADRKLDDARMGVMTDLEAANDNNNDNDNDSDTASGQVVHASDFKRKQEFSGIYLLWLAYQSTGVIYGDIGTSPLYVFSSTFSSPPSYIDLMGSLSLIIWSLTLMVTVKYVTIVLYADDEGEGGTFALYSLLTRY